MKPRSTNISLYLQERTIAEIDAYAKRMLAADPSRRKVSRSEAAERLIWEALGARAKGRERNSRT